MTRLSSYLNSVFLIRHFIKPAKSNIGHTIFFSLEFFQEEIDLIQFKRRISVPVLYNSDSSTDSTDRTDSTDNLKVC